MTDKKEWLTYAGNAGAETEVDEESIKRLKSGDYDKAPEDLPDGLGLSASISVDISPKGAVDIEGGLGCNMEAGFAVSVDGLSGEKIGHLSECPACFLSAGPVAQLAVAMHLEMRRVDIVDLAIKRADRMCADARESVPELMMQLMQMLEHSKEYFDNRSELSEDEKALYDMEAEGKA